MKDPFDMDKAELKEEKARLESKPWMTQEQSNRHDLVTELLEEIREAAESSVKQMY